MQLLVGRLRPSRAVPLAGFLTPAGRRALAMYLAALKRAISAGRSPSCGGGSSLEIAAYVFSENATHLV